MKQKKELNNKKIGDRIVVFIPRAGGLKIKVEGILKEFKRPFGRPTYLISEGKVEDFWIRNYEE